jgi:hypothetical protein
MTRRTLPILLSTVAAAAFGAAISISAVTAQVVQDPPKNIAPGMNPSTGQINPGVAVQPPAGAPPGANDQSGEGAKVTNRAPPSDTHAATNQPIPTPEEARAALLAPDSPDPAIGQIALPATGAAHTAKSATGDAPAENAKAQQAENNAQSRDGASAGNESTGKATQEDDAAKQAAHGTSPNKPISSTTQTLPAKFSERNSVLDRLPTMAWPLRLSDEERGKVFDAMMAAQGNAVDLGNLKPADQLPAELALNAMHPLPQQLAAEPVFNNIQAVKGKDKVLLVNPATRIIVDVINKS